MLSPSAQDAKARSHALDPNQSFLIQAPAGSGKTQLLVARYMHLLLTCNKPDAVLCVTFTKKACGEMQERMHMALNLHTQQEPEKPHERELWQVSHQVAKHAKARGWCLDTLTQKLEITTMDSAFQSFLKKAPSPYRETSKRNLITEPESLYQEALEDFFQSLDTHPDYQKAYCQLLEANDHRQARIEALLLKVLATRNMWLGQLIPASNTESFTARMQNQLHHLYTHTQEVLLKTVPWDDFYNLFETTKRLQALLASLNHTQSLIMGLPCMLEDARTTLDFWKPWRSFLLTKTGSLKKRFTSREGFLNAATLSSLKATHADDISRLQKTLSAAALKLCIHQEFTTQLKQLELLPEVEDVESEWSGIAPLCTLLPLLVAHCHAVFERKQAIDFCGISMEVEAALQDPNAEPPLAYTLYQHTQHLLIDEFQDTSQAQFSLFERILSSWNDGSCRSVALIGDPMQSIYRFRGADVSLFNHCKRVGIAGIRLTHLNLTHNYRSYQGLVNWNNEVFSQASGVDGFQKALPTKTDNDFECITFCEAENDHEEALSIAKTISNWQKHHPNDTIAILVRARSHLTNIIAHLKAQNIAYEAIGIEPLNRMQLGHDLLAHYQLFDFGNKRAWLALLRSPVVGLPYHCLWKLCRSSECLYSAIMQPPDTLEPSSLLRLSWLKPFVEEYAHDLSCLGPCMAARKLWLALGWQKLVSGLSFKCAEAFWLHVYELECSGCRVSEKNLINLLTSINTSPLPTTPSSNTKVPQVQKVHILTVHKAKGLEYDRVIIPALHKKIQHDNKELLVQHSSYCNGKALLWLHSYPKLERDMTSMMRYLRHLERQSSSDESNRVLYVALTRAKKAMHLTAQKTITNTHSWLSLCLEQLGKSTQQTVPKDPNAATSDHTESNTHGLWRRSDKAYEYLKHCSIESRAQRSVSLTPDNENTHWGTLVHLCMQRVHLHGLDSVCALEHFLCQQAILLPFRTSSAHVRAQCAVIARQLQGMHNDPIAKWIFNPNHKHIMVEQSLHLAHGKSSIRLDRVFYDTASKLFWIIDFKTHQSNSQRILHEQMQQLHHYQTAINELYPHYEVKVGVYNPLLQRWKVLNCREQYAVQE